MWTVNALAGDLAAGRTTSRALVETALARIAEPAGEGARAFIKVYAESARADADQADRLRKAGIVRSALDGLPVSVKDLFDVAGDITRAGSKLLADAPVAQADAPAVAKLRAAGAVILGRSNMVEFAFGAVGTNPHYGTPKNPWDRPRAGADGASLGGRVPGGSSSGAAVAVADGMCVMGLGSDTRGSIRQPAALCGIAGFKPTARRVSRQGAFPLSYTLDSIGPLANTVACCAAYDAVLAGECDAVLKELPARGLRLLLPRSSALEDLDPAVAQAFEASLAALSRAGAVIEERKVPAFDRQADYFRNGGFAAAEAYAIHRRWSARIGEYDPRVAKRVLLGKDIVAWEHVELGLLRAAFMNEIGALMAPFDAFLMPTAPCIAPTIAEASASDEAYFRWNLRILRNTGLANFLDGCAATLPCHAPGEAPVGLMVCGVAMSDRHVLAAAHAVEGVLARGQ
ncbi:MAG: amidase [Betaproteobacteria bacterium]|nr:amidase [Betaproteobacteria bacterium]